MATFRRGFLLSALTASIMLTAGYSVAAPEREQKGTASPAALARLLADTSQSTLTLPASFFPLSELGASSAIPESAVKRNGNIGPGITTGPLQWHGDTLHLRYRVRVNGDSQWDMACDASDMLHIRLPDQTTGVWLVDPEIHRATRLGVNGKHVSLSIPVVTGGKPLDDYDRSIWLLFLGRAGLIEARPLQYQVSISTLFQCRGDRTINKSTFVESRSRVEVDGTLDLQSGDGPVYLHVKGGTLAVRDLQLNDDSALYVEQGRVELTGDGSEEPIVIAGTFLLIDSWGSLYIEDDTEFSGSTLQLVSHIVISSGVTVRVTGDMVLDGCVVEADHPDHRYAFVVEPGADFQMARTVMRQCGWTNAPPHRSGLYIDSTNAEVQSCRFEYNAVGLLAGSNSTECALYHNVFTDNAEADALDLGTANTWSRDDWGSVYSTRPAPSHDPAPTNDTKNNLVLNLSGSDGAGDLAIQTGKVLEVTMDVDALLEPISGCEAILGFSSAYFLTNGVLLTEGDWTNVILESWGETTGARGLLDTAVGLGLDSPREGISSDQTIVTVMLQARTNEGITKVYFRPHLESDGAAGTRLASDPDGQSGHYLTPFTMNTGYITVDGTPPDVRGLAATQALYGVDRDVLGSGAETTVPGTAYVTVQARNTLSGLADGEPSLVLSSQSDPSYELAFSEVNRTEIEDGTDTWWQVTWAAAVSNDCPNGIYDVACSAEDKAGNVSDPVSSTLTVNHNRIAVTVDSEGWNAPSNKTRDVTFAATDSAGSVLKAWTLSCAFTDADQSYPGRAERVLYDIPDDTAYLSAKTDYSLRTRLSAVLADGEADVSFTGSDLLYGGDLNGDNRITVFDYAIMRTYWLTTNTAADISGDGQVSTRDYVIMSKNWYTQGDPE